MTVVPDRVAVDVAVPKWHATFEGLTGAILRPMVMEEPPLTASLSGETVVIAGQVPEFGIVAKVLVQVKDDDLLHFRSFPALHHVQAV